MANSPARAAVDVGSVIADTYTIEALLGRGGMGAVFLASHKRLAGKRVAIKILHTEIEDTEVVARFKREAEIAAKLNHPNIVGVIDYNVSADGMPYLVLDYLEGETLAQCIARGPMPLDQVLSIVRQVGSALAAAHRAGIVHRDLKPQNIFLVPTEVDGRHLEIAKVLDFGISKIRGSQTVKTQDSVLLGTPQYMAPEQATGQHASIDERTDVFALGAIVYEMLSGQAAFAGESLPAVVFKVVYEQPPPLAQEAPSVPPVIVAAVNRAMAKPSEDRFPTVTGFVEAMTGQPLAVRDAAPASLSAPGAPSGSRRAAVTAGEAFDKTMGSGQFGDAPVDPMLATAAPSTGQRPRTPSSTSAATAAGAPRTMSAGTMPGGHGGPAIAVAQGTARSVNPANVSDAGSAGSAAATPTVDLRLRDRAPGKRRAGLLAAVLLAGAAVAAGVTYAVTRPGERSVATTPLGAPLGQQIATAGSGSAHSADTKPADTKPADTKPADTKPADTKPADTKPADTKPAGPKSAGPKPAGPKPASPKPPVVASGHEPASGPDGIDDNEGDGDVREKLQQATAALARREYDLAERLANAVINSSGTPKQRASGRLIHGTVQCVARNDQEAAQIDLRGLQNFRMLRSRLVTACRNHGVQIGQ